MKFIFQAIRLFIVLMILTGLVYPLIITVIAKGIFPDKADGSLIKVNGKIIGSELLAQKFDNNRYFWPRPSAINFQTVPSGASNAGPTSKALKESVKARIAFLLKTSYIPSGNIPDDLLFASGSGLDPHITPKAAFFQIKRIVKYRNLDNSQEKELYKLVQNSIEYPQFGYLGEPRINVLLLNIKLNSLFTKYECNR